MVTLRTPHAKNQPPRPKTVAYRRITDRHTHRHTQTHRVTERKNTEYPFFEFDFLVFDSSIEGAVQLINFRKQQRVGLRKSIRRRSCRKINLNEHLYITP